MGAEDLAGRARRTSPVGREGIYRGGHRGVLGTPFDRLRVNGPGVED